MATKTDLLFAMWKVGIPLEQAREVWNTISGPVETETPEPLSGVRQQFAPLVERIREISLPLTEGRQRAPRRALPDYTTKMFGTRLVAWVDGLIPGVIFTVEQCARINDWSRNKGSLDALRKALRRLNPPKVKVIAGKGFLRINHLVVS